VSSILLSSGSESLLSSSPFGVVVGSLLVSSSSLNVVFLRQEGALSVLYSVPTNASASHLRLSPSASSVDILNVVLLPNAARAVFWAVDTASNAPLLVSSSFSNSSDQPVISTAVAGETLATPFVSSNSLFTLFERADQTTAGLKERGKKTIEMITQQIFFETKQVLGRLVRVQFLVLLFRCPPHWSSFSSQFLHSFSNDSNTFHVCDYSFSYFTNKDGKHPRYVYFEFVFSYFFFIHSSLCLIRASRSKSSSPMSSFCFFESDNWTSIKRTT
jgi:hypothetical protein